MNPNSNIAPADNDKPTSQDILYLDKNNTGKDYVVGDLHGNLKCLQAILHNLQKEDRLFIAGDLVDRGEDSLALVQLLIAESNKTNGHKIYIIRGNHEDEFIKYKQALEDFMSLTQEQGPNSIEASCAQENAAIQQRHYRRCGGQWAIEIMHVIMTGDLTISDYTQEQNDNLRTLISKYLKKNLDPSIAEVSADDRKQLHSMLDTVYNYFHSLPYVTSIDTGNKDGFNLVHANLMLTDEELITYKNKNYVFTSDQINQLTQARSFYDERNPTLMLSTARNASSAFTYCGHTIAQGLRPMTAHVNLDVEACNTNQSLVVNHTDKTMHLFSPEGEIDFEIASDRVRKALSTMMPFFLHGATKSEIINQIRREQNNQDASVYWQHQQNLLGNTNSVISLELFNELNDFYKNKINIITDIKAKTEDLPLLEAIEKQNKMLNDIEYTIENELYEDVVHYFDKFRFNVLVADINNKSKKSVSVNRLSISGFIECQKEMLAEVLPLLNNNLVSNLEKHFASYWLDKLIARINSKTKEAFGTEPPTLTAFVKKQNQILIQLEAIDSELGPKLRSFFENDWCKRIIREVDSDSRSASTANNLSITAFFNTQHEMLRTYEPLLTDTSYAQLFNFFEKGWIDESIIYILDATEQLNLSEDPTFTDVSIEFVDQIRAQQCMLNDLSIVLTPLCNQELLNYFENHWYQNAINLFENVSDQYIIAPSLLTFGETIVLEKKVARTLISVLESHDALKKALQAYLLRHWTNKFIVRLESKFINFAPHQKHMELDKLFPSKTDINEALYRRLLHHFNIVPVEQQQPHHSTRSGAQLFRQANNSTDFNSNVSKNINGR